MPKGHMSIYDQLLTQMSEEDMDQRIGAYIKSGDAHSRRSAANKVYRDISVESVGEESVEGLWLQIFKRKDNSLSGYVCRSNGEVTRLTIPPDIEQPELKLVVGLPVLVGPCDRMRNVFTDSRWLEARQDTQFVAPETEDLRDKTLTDFAWTVDRIEGEGLFVVRGTIRFVNLVGVFEETSEGGQRELSHNKPLIDGDDVNLRLTIASYADEGGSDPAEYLCSTKVVDKAFLGHLLDSPELDWLRNMSDEEAMLREVQDMLMGLQVVVFGRGANILTNRAGEVIQQLERPFMDFSRVGFIQVVSE